MRRGAIAVMGLASSASVSRRRSPFGAWHRLSLGVGQKAAKISYLGTYTATVL